MKTARSLVFLTLLAMIAGGGALSAADQSHLILLNAGAVDLRKTHAAVAESFTGRRLHLVQFNDAVRPDWRAALLATGVEVVTYIPNNAYLVYGDAAALTRVHQLASSASFVRGEDSYVENYKIDPAGKSGKNEDSLVAVQLIRDSISNPGTIQLIDSLKLDSLEAQFNILNYLNVIVRLSRDATLILSRQTDVISIQSYALPKKLDERQDQIVAGNLSGNVPSGPGYLTWLGSKGFTQSQFTASGFAVDVTDSGIDDGTSSPNHFGLYVGGTLPGISRVIYNRLEGTPNSGSTLLGCDGHGTLNAHLVGGFDNFATFPHVDAAGYHYGLGVAPFVKLGSSVIFDPISYTFPDFANLQSQAYNDGARVSTNSWGSDNGGRYDVDSQAFDALVRDAQPAGSTFAAAGNQEMVMVFAAGNSGPAGQTVASPASAKNVITVGAGENVQAFGGADLCGVSDVDADNANQVSAFSSRGPTIDGRRKPDLMAPGSHVSGGVIQTLTPGANGQADTCFSGVGICGGVGSLFFPAGQQFFTASSGTSQACPAVAGAAALLRQDFINHGLDPPSAAMTKAVLSNAARFMTGSANDGRWSNQQGMGEVDLGRAFDGTPRILRDQVSSDIFTATGQTRSFTGTISSPSAPLRITLAWTDAPGSTTGAAYNNDLDLIVNVGGTAYLGNNFFGADSITGGSADTRNNMESVFLPAGLTGSFSVTVKASNINSDGVPNFGGPLDQDFVLVISNAVESSVAVISTADTQVSGESCGPPNQAVDPGETVTVQFGMLNSGTATTTNLVATLLASGGVVSPSGPQTYGALAPGTNAARPFTFQASGSCGGVLTATFTLQDGETDLGQVHFTLPLGTTVGGTTATSAPAAISIPILGTATPYPSPIQVSGVSGTVRKVTVTLNNLSHTYPDDLDILLVGPRGQSVTLMSDVGGGEDINNVTLTFDDAAATSLPDGIGITSGTYKPTNIGIDDVYPTPAPAPPYGTALSGFNSKDPNGTWNLYIVDDEDEDGGTLAGGWTLTITTSDPVCCVLPGTLQFSDPTYSVTEGLIGARILVTRTAGSNGTVSVRMTTSDGTATAGADYVATAEIVTFPPGDTSTHTVVVPMLEDQLDEDDETVNLTLSNPTGGAVLGNQTTAVLTIIDNDPTPSLSINDVSVAEGNSGTVTALFTATLSAASGRAVSVGYATADGTATAGSDYLSTSGTLNFSAGATTRTIPVIVNGDLLNEPDETFFLNLNAPVNATLSDAQAIGTIISDDILSVTSVAPTSGPADGAGTATIQGTTFEAGATVKFGSTSATNTVVDGPTQIHTTIPTLSPGTLNDVVVTNANSLSAALSKGFFADFTDVPAAHLFHNAVETIFRRGITAGCGGGNYCPDMPVRRDQMAIFLLRGEHGGSYAPPAPTGTLFADVHADAFGAAFIEQIYAEGITAGCAVNPLRYCPADPLSRAQMAVFLLRAQHGGSYDPPPATGLFADVPLSDPFVRWIEQLYRQGITSGCASNPLRYCPTLSASRGQMAVFLVNTFGLTNNSQ